jgi:UPF0755 protein
MRRLNFILPLALVSLLCGVLVYLVAFLLVPPSLEQNARIVEIPEGAGLRQVAVLLSENGLIAEKLPFVIVGKLTLAERRLQAGEYAFHTRMSPHEILQMLTSGEVLKHEVTLPEGMTVAQIARLLDDQGLIAYEAFMRPAQDPQWIRSLGIEAASLEGYLYPETYYFSKRAGAEKIIRAMVEMFNRIYAPDLEERARALSMTRAQVVTLASIIEKETSVDSERPLISAVFHNRIKKKMPLQSDPTVIYALPNFNGNLTRKNLRIASPYNTYRINGLPPGPIANPGRASLIAALYPAPVNYLYFVSKNDGSHHFSSTLAEHNRAVKKYQKRSASRAMGGTDLKSAPIR